MATTDHIVVGVDEYPSSLTAVDLGMLEAELHGCPVLLVHADPWADHPAWRDRRTEPNGEPSGADQAIQAALGRARTGLATQVSAMTVPGSPSRALLAQALHASMVVVGHRGMGGFTELALGSVALQLAGHAPCPVLVARGGADPEYPVVVGVDGSPANEPAIAFAFEEAFLRRVDLVAVHTWIDPVALDPGSRPRRFDPDLAEAEERDLVATVLSSWRAKYPEVAVEHRLLHGRAPKALIEASGRGQLMVLGARGRGGFPGLRLGSVTHALLHHSLCPVAVVHHGGPIEEWTEPEGSPR